MEEEEYYFIIIKNKKINKILDRIAIKGHFKKTNTTIKALNRQVHEGVASEILEKILVANKGELKKLVKKYEIEENKNR